MFNPVLLAALDCFIRVTVTDEDSRGLVAIRGEAGTDLGDLLDRVKQVCTDGLPLAGRTFHFLGASSRYAFSLLIESIQSINHFY